MKFTKLTKYYLFIAVATFIAVVVVIVQQSYSKLMGPINVARTSNLTKPISPNLDTQIIDQIEARKEYLSSEIINNAPNLGQETPTLTPSP